MLSISQGAIPLRLRTTGGAHTTQHQLKGLSDPRGLVAPFVIMENTKQRKGRYVTALISDEAAKRLEEEVYATGVNQHKYLKNLIELALLDARPTVGA